MPVFGRYEAVKVGVPCRILRARVPGLGVPVTVLLSAKVTDSEVAETGRNDAKVQVYVVFAPGPVGTEDTVVVLHGTVCPPAFQVGNAPSVVPVAVVVNVTAVVPYV